MEEAEDQKAPKEKSESGESEDVESLRNTLSEKNKLAEEYYDRMLRIQAEFENYKKRTERELAEFRVYANAQLVRDLLVILDDFQSALSSREDDSNKEFLKGFEMIYNNLLGTLEKEGLSKIDPKSEKFDPWKHEAVEMIPTSDEPEHTVLGVIQTGYKFRDKILRPAKVRVSTAPPGEIKSCEVEDNKGSNKNENEKDKVDD